MTDNLLIQLLDRTINQLACSKIETTNLRKLHREKSKNFVEQLANSFRDYYKSNHNIRTFSKHYYEQRKEFGLNEYLYDILVCEFDILSSHNTLSSLYYIKHSLWSIESEFSPNRKEALKDFNKLVISNSENKLFIGPLNPINEKYINTLLPAAKNCNGNVYVCLLTHPSEWADTQINFKIWKFIEEWKSVYSSF